MADDGPPHCKDVDHLEVVVSAASAQKVTATFMADMRCHNDTSYRGWGVVLSMRPKKPLEGPHLYPHAVQWMPGALREAAAVAKAGQVVQINHTIGGRPTKFAAVSPADAVRLAFSIEQEAAKAA